MGCELPTYHIHHDQLKKKGMGLENRGVRILINHKYQYIRK